MANPLRTTVQLTTKLARTRKTNAWICPSCQYQQLYLSRSGKSFSTTSKLADDHTPPLLSQIKADLKTALRAKDTARLNVLRAVIAETNNASKTNSPIKTDLQLLAVLRKKRSASQAAADEARKVSRADLVDKQEGEIRILDEYAKTVEKDLLGEDEIRRLVTDLVEKIKDAAQGAEIKAGNVMKEVFKSDGIFAGKSVDKGAVTKVVTSVLGGEKKS